jgi:hypothetical protein
VSELRTVRVLLLLSFLLISLTTASALTVSIPDGSGAVGDTTSISVNVKDAQNIGSMDLVIAYDPEILKVVKVEKGGLVKGLFSSNTEQTGIVAIGIVDSKGINGNGEIAKITFEVLKEGESRINIVDAKAYDVESHIDIKVTGENGVFKAEKAEKTGETDKTEKAPTPAEEKKSPGFEAGFAVVALAVVLMLRRGREK